MALTRLYQLLSECLDSEDLALSSRKMVLEALVGAARELSDSQARVAVSPHGMQELAVEQPESALSCTRAPFPCLGAALGVVGKTRRFASATQIEPSKPNRCTKGPFKGAEPGSPRRPATSWCPW